MTAAAELPAPANRVAGAARPVPGDRVVSHNPANPAQVVWSGAPPVSDVDDAVAAARGAFRAWSDWPAPRRAEALHGFARLADAHAEELAALIRLETGKPIWDARAEAKLLAAKVNVSLDASFPAGVSRVAGYELPLTDAKTARCHFRPHGVMSVVGPFNFPAHLPNGHIIPALAVGNTVVFKPSDKTPAVGQRYAELLDRALAEAGAPPGVFNLVQGGADVAARLTAHEGVDGVLFTGSWPVGRRILEANLDHPGRIVALELGGNNPAVVLEDADLRQAVIECLRCCFITAGQRCTCTRRIILHEAIADRFLNAFVKGAAAIAPGDPAHEDTFLGPVIRAAPRDAVLEFAQRAADQGAEVLVEPRVAEPAGCAGGHFVTPGVLRVDRFTAQNQGPGRDHEVFGPLARVAVASSFDEAIAQANATRFGLAASVFTRSKDAADRFLREARAGCVNVNTGTAGASGKLPFGGLGHSGNHRPAAAFAHDYCAYPVASMLESGDAAALAPGMRFEQEWID